MDAENTSTHAHVPRPQAAQAGCPADNPEHDAQGGNQPQEATVGLFVFFFFPNVMLILHQLAEAKGCPGSWDTLVLGASRHMSGRDENLIRQAAWRDLAHQRGHRSVHQGPKWNKTVSPSPPELRRLSCAAHARQGPQTPAGSRPSQGSRLWTAGRGPLGLHNHVSQSPCVPLEISPWALLLPFARRALNTARAGLA